MHPPAAGREHRLRSAHSEIDHGQTPVTECHSCISVDPDAAVVGPAVLQRSTPWSTPGLRSRSALVDAGGVENAGNPAHARSVRPSSSVCGAAAWAPRSTGRGEDRCSLRRPCNTRVRDRHSRVPTDRPSTIGEPGPSSPSKVLSHGSAVVGILPEATPDAIPETVQNRLALGFPWPFADAGPSRPHATCAT